MRMVGTLLAEQDENGSDNSDDCREAEGHADRVDEGREQDGQNDADHVGLLP